ncbi:15982_t:CDS:10, partial [Acaulospora colombiana]
MFLICSYAFSSTQLVRLRVNPPTNVSPIAAQNEPLYGGQTQRMSLPAQSDLTLAYINPPFYPSTKLKPTLSIIELLPHHVWLWRRFFVLFGYVGLWRPIITRFVVLLGVGKAAVGMVTNIKVGPPSVWAILSFSYGAVNINRFIDEKLYNYTEARETDWWFWVQWASYLGGTLLAVYIVIPFLLSAGWTPLAVISLLGALFIASLFLPSIAMKKTIESAFDWSMGIVKKGWRSLKEAFKSFFGRNDTGKVDEIQDEKDEDSEAEEPQERVPYDGEVRRPVLPITEDDAGWSLHHRRWGSSNFVRVSPTSRRPIFTERATLYEFIDRIFCSSSNYRAPGGSVENAPTLEPTSDSPSYLHHILSTPSSITLKRVYFATTPEPQLSTPLPLAPEKMSQQSSQKNSPSTSQAGSPTVEREPQPQQLDDNRRRGRIRRNSGMLFPDNLDMFPDNEYTREHGIKRNDGMLFPDNLDIFDYKEEALARSRGGRNMQKQKDPDEGKKDTLKLRLDLNLDVDVQIRARVHGDVTLSLFLNNPAGEISADDDLLVQSQTDITMQRYEEFILLSTAEKVQREIRVLHQYNAQAERDKAPPSSIIEKLERELEAAYKLGESKDLSSIEFSSQPSNEISPSSSTPTRAQPLSLADEPVAPFELLSNKETKHSGELSPEIKVIQNKIESHQLALDVMQETTKACNELITRLRAQLFRLVDRFCPSIRLLPELLLEIFQHRIAQDVDQYLEGMTKYLPHTTLKLSHVCRSWRLVATNNSILWRDTVVYPHRKWTDRKVELFKHYSSNAQRTSLSLFVEVEPEFAYGFPDSDHPTFDYYGDDFKIHFRVKQFVDGVSWLPYLKKNPESLSVHNLHPYGLGAYQVMELVEWHSCHRVTIHGYFNNDWHVEALGPLTHLTLETSGGLNSIHLVSSPNSFEELHLMNREENISPGPHAAITLPSLKVLGISLIHLQTARILQLPALQTAIFYSAPGLFNIHLSEEQLDSLSSLIANATELQLYPMSQVMSHFPKKNSASAFAIGILRRSTKFRTITFSSGFVDVLPLHEHLPSLVTKGIGSGATIEEMHFIDFPWRARGACQGETHMTKVRPFFDLATTVLSEQAPSKRVIHKLKVCQSLSIMEKYAQSNIKPSYWEKHLLLSAASDVQKEIEALKDRNYQSEQDKKWKISIIEKLKEELKIAYKEEGSQNSYIFTSSQKEGQISSSDSTQERSPATSDGSVTPLDYSSDEENRHVPSTIEEAERELEFRRLILEVKKDVITTRNGAITSNLPVSNLSRCRRLPDRADYISTSYCTYIVAYGATPQQVKDLVKWHSCRRVMIHGYYDAINDTNCLGSSTHLTLDTMDKINSLDLASHLDSCEELRLLNDEHTIPPASTKPI